MRSRLFFVGLLISTIGACSAGGADSTVFDGAAGPPDTNGPDAASGGETDARLTPKFAAPSLVLVNGLVTGGTKAFKDVRVCLDSSGFALPDDRAMPLSNMPGVARGTGTDLGKTHASMVHVFQAADVDDAAWYQDRTADCGKLLGAGAGAKPHLSLPITIGGTTLAVLVDDPTDLVNGIALRTAILPSDYDGTPDRLQAVVADFSTLRGTRPVTARLGTYEVGPLGEAAAIPVTPYAWSVAGAYETQTVAVDVMESTTSVETYAQTLGSIQYASDPTQAPGPFFDRRTTFLFVLIGAPADRHVINAIRDPKFDGTGLHFAAVPYSAVAP